MADEVCSLDTDDQTQSSSLVPDFVPSLESSQVWKYNQFKREGVDCNDDEQAIETEVCQFVRKLREKKAEICRFDSVVIRKGSRSVTITPDSAEKFLEIVGGNAELFHKFDNIGGTQFANYNIANVELEVQGGVGPCPELHMDRLIWVASKYKSKDDAGLQMEVFSDWFLWPPWAEPVEYKIRLNTCGHSFPVFVRVYPDIEMGVQIELQLSQAEISSLTQNNITNDKSGYGRRTNAGRVEKKKLVSIISDKETISTEKFTKSLSIGGYYKFSGVEIEIKKVFKDIIETIRFVESIPQKLNTFVGDSGKEKDKLLAENNISKQKSKNSFTLSLGKLVLRFLGGWQEIDGSNKCEYGFVIVLAAKPLFEFSWKIDITGWVLKSNPFGQAIGSIKDFLNDLGQEALQVNFSIGVKFNIEPRFEFRVSHPNGLKVTGKTELEFPGKLEIKVIKVSIHRWKLNMEGEVSASGESGFKLGCKVDSSGCILYIEWTGAKISFVSKVDVSFGSQENGKPLAPAKPPSDPKSGLNKPGDEKTKEKEDPSVDFVVKIPGQVLLKNQIIKLKS